MLLIQLNFIYAFIIVKYITVTQLMQSSKAGKLEVSGINILTLKLIYLNTWWLVKKKIKRIKTTYYYGLLLLF